jgi:hypothetical protein
LSANTTVKPNCDPVKCRGPVLFIQVKVNLNALGSDIVDTINRVLVATFCGVM